MRPRPFEEYLATGWTLIGTADTALARRSMRLFADEVAPAMAPVAPAQL